MACSRSGQRTSGPRPMAWITRHGPNDELRAELVELARKAGLLTFQAPRRFGGREPSHREQAVLYEAAGWSTLGPVALNCAAPAAPSPPRPPQASFSPTTATPSCARST